jgi:hypothetical protein
VHLPIDEQDGEVIRAGEDEAMAEESHVTDAEAVTPHHKKMDC